LAVWLKISVQSKIIRVFEKSWKQVGTLCFKVSNEGRNIIDSIAVLIISIHKGEWSIRKARTRWCCHGGQGFLPFEKWFRQKTCQVVLSTL
jgi:hypothetical protein